MTAKKATKKTRKKVSKGTAENAVIEESVNLEGRYVLPRNLEIADIAQVYKDVQKFLKESFKKCVIDAGEVALIDTAGIQFIVHVLTVLRSRDCEVSWENDSIQVYQMAAELGLEEQLEA